MIEMSIPDILGDCLQQKAIADEMLNSIVFNTTKFCDENKLDSIYSLANNSESELLTRLISQVKIYDSCRKPLIAIVAQYETMIIPGLEKIQCRLPVMSISLEHIQSIEEHAEQYIAARTKKKIFNSSGNNDAAEQENCKMNQIQKIYLDKPAGDLDFILYQKKILLLERMIIAEKGEAGCVALSELGKKLENLDFSVSLVSSSSSQLEVFDSDFEGSETTLCLKTLEQQDVYNSDDDPFENFSDDNSDDDSSLEQKFSDLSISSPVFTPGYNDGLDLASMVQSTPHKAEPIQKKSRSMTL